MRLFALSLVVIAFALLTGYSLGQDASALPGEPYVPDAGPVIVSDRPICSLVNADAAAAGIAGQDGGASIVVGDKQYYMFGDTIRSDGIIIPNNAAVSNDASAADCIQMTHAQSGGLASPLIEPMPGETTLWPNWMFANGSSLYYSISSVVPGPSPWWVRGVGLGKLDTASMQSTRVHELMWDQSSGFGDWVMGVTAGIPQPDGYMYLLLHTSTDRILLARVEPLDVENIDAYQHWDGVAWRGAPSAFTGALWTQSDGFNGVAVRWSAPLGKWIAMYQSVWGSFVRVRTADALTGPWSGETEWIDCARWAAAHLLPKCYSGSFHPQFDGDGGRTMYITFSVPEPYHVELHEVRLGVAVRAWRANSGDVRLQPASPGAAYVDEGIAFYASDVPVPGFGAVRRWRSPGGEITYAIYGSTGATDTGIAFYTPPRSDIGTNTTYDPVYRWDRGSEHVYSALPGWEALGYVRGPAVFYAVCGDSDMDQASACAEAVAGTDPQDRDSDGDIFGDRQATLANPNADLHRDNCPAVANADQVNSNGEPWGTGGARDATHPAADVLGDACDGDLDNDGLSDSSEASAHTDPASSDTDADGWPDAAEIACDTDPLAQASRPNGPDTDGDGASDACELLLDSSPDSLDTDADGLNDMLEIRWQTNANAWDTDGDGVRDVCEIASVNLDRPVNIIDLMLIAQGILAMPTPQADIDRNGIASSVDLAYSARQFGKC